MNDGMVIDCFAGGGGASQGIEEALGRPCDVAVNHDPKAIAMHKANHPRTHHMTEDIWKADLEGYYDGTPVSKTQQVRMIGNSVVPIMARKLVAANVA